MRRFLACLMVLILLTPAYGQVILIRKKPVVGTPSGSVIALVNSVASPNTDPTGGPNTTPAMDTTGATGIILVLGHFSWGGAFTITDNKGNGEPAFAVTSIEPTQGSQVSIYFWIAPVVGLGHTFTVTGASVWSAVGVLAVSGVNLTAPLDQVNGGFSASSLSAQPGSVTPLQNDELLVTGLVSYPTPFSTVSLSSGFTVDQFFPFSASSSSMGVGHKIQTTAGAENPTWSYASATQSAAAIATFKSTLHP